METSILQWKEGASVRMQMIKDEPWFAAKRCVRAAWT